MAAITRGLGVCVVLAGAAVGLAGPALAEPSSGPYTVTYIDGAGVFDNGSTTTWILSSCGTDCTHVDTQAKYDMDLHREGNSWNGLWGPSNSCTASLDDSSLVLTETCPNLPNLVAGLTKNG